MEFFLCNDAIPTLNNKLDMTVYEPDFITRFNDSGFVDIDLV